MNKENLQQLEVARTKLFNICELYKKAKPVLKFAKGVLFFKPKWASMIGLLITTLDEICNDETNN